MKLIKLNEIKFNVIIEKLFLKWSEIIEQFVLNFQLRQYIINFLWFLSLILYLNGIDHDSRISNFLLIETFNM